MLAAVVKLMVHANAMLVLPTMEVYAQDVPVELSTALKVRPASTYVVRTPSMTLKLTSVPVILAMAFSTAFVTPALKTTSSTVDIVSLAQSTQSSTKSPTNVIVVKVTTSIKLASVLENVEPMKTTILIVNNAFAFRV